ncbi:MAG: hypothetical protein K6F09_04575 [Clostridiales bacterium]|nr:hypothetical protein [Clostridiales bacterium]
MNNGVDFFLGSNTPSGFHSFFGELYDAESDWRAFIIKGGPGTGKSGMMKKIAEECDDIGVHPERIRCASDPKSLDALIFEDAKICIADGTSPHIIEPEYPGAVENLIDLGAFWDADKLYSERNEIMDLSLKNRSLHDRCVRFLSSAASLARDLKRIGLGCAEKEKAERWASRLAARRIGSPTGKIGREKHRFLDAPTPLGIYFLRTP